MSPSPRGIFLFPGLTATWSDQTSRFTCSDKDWEELLNTFQPVESEPEAPDYGWFLINEFIKKFGFGKPIGRQRRYSYPPGPERVF